MKRILFVLLLLCISVPAMADVTIIQKIHTAAVMGQPEKNTISTMYIKGDKARVDSEGLKSYTIFDLGGKKIYMIDPDKKTMYTATLDEIKAAGDVLDKLMQGSKAKSTTKKTGNKQTINGFDCEEYVISTSGPMMSISGNYWVTDDIDAKEFDAFRPFAEDVGKMLGPDALAEIKGMPVKTVVTMKMMGQNMSSSSELQKISHEAVDSSKFVIPTGYETKSMPKMPKK